MKLTKCSNGHFYDAEKFSTCPHCSGANMSGNMNDNPTDFALKGPIGASSATDKTVGAPINNVQNIARHSDSGIQGGMDEGKTVGFMDNWYQQNQQKQNNQASQNTTPSKADDEGKTIGYFVNKQNESRQSTNQSENYNPQPVVGWLVCIEGIHYGKSFNLYCGKNFIGRSQDMDVCLAGDSTVSRVRHASIIYEPKARMFFAQPGESHELTYLNGSVVLSNTELKDRDVITIGKTSLVFVPFCDEKYGWVNE